MMVGVIGLLLSSATLYCHSSKWPVGVHPHRLLVYNCWRRSQTQGRCRYLLETRPLSTSPSHKKYSISWDWIMSNLIILYGIPTQLVPTCLSQNLFLSSLTLLFWATNMRSNCLAVLSSVKIASCERAPSQTTGRRETSQKPVGQIRCELV